MTLHSNPNRFRNPVTGLPDTKMFNLHVESALQAAAVQGTSCVLVTIVLRGLERLAKPADEMLELYRPYRPEVAAPLTCPAVFGKWPWVG